MNLTSLRRRFLALRRRATTSAHLTLSGEQPTWRSTLAARSGHWGHRVRVASLPELLAPNEAVAGPLC
jgi:hypothetical protein